MKCPKNCTTPLHITERHGIEIDYCPECRGVWLDRGELDKIIERAAALETPRVAGPPLHEAPPVRDPYRRDERGYRYDDDDDDDRYKRRKKKSFLGELFDF